jgi:hypothetical protein
VAPSGDHEQPPEVVELLLAVEGFGGIVLVDGPGGGVVGVCPALGALATCSGIIPIRLCSLSLTLCCD